MANKCRMAVFVLVMLFIARTNASAESFMKTILLTVNGEMRSTNTWVNTVAEFLQKEGIELREKDEINFNLDDKLNDAMPNTLKITRSYNVYVVIDDDEPFEFEVGPSEKMGHILEELSDKNGREYVYDGFMNDTLKEGDIVYLSTTLVKQFTTTEKIPYETETQYTLEIEEGEQQITQEGEYGEITTVTEVTYVGGEEQSQEIISEEVTKSLVNEVILIGDVREVVNELKTPDENFNYEYVLTMEASAYSAQQASLSSHTSSGHLAVYGVVAVDPGVIPLGTWLYIEGYGKALASDTGGDIKGNRIDLCFNTISECLTFGRRDITVYVLSEE